MTGLLPAFMQRPRYVLLRAEALSPRIGSETELENLSQLADEDKGRVKLSERWDVWRDLILAHRRCRDQVKILESVQSLLEFSRRFKGRERSFRDDLTEAFETLLHEKERVRGVAFEPRLTTSRWRNTARSLGDLADDCLGGADALKDVARGFGDRIAEFREVDEKFRRAARSFQGIGDEPAEDPAGTGGTPSPANAAPRRFREQEVRLENVRRRHQRVKGALRSAEERLASVGGGSPGGTAEDANESEQFEAVAVEFWRVGREFSSVAREFQHVGADLGDSAEKLALRAKDAQVAARSARNFASQEGERARKLAAEREDASGDFANLAEGEDAFGEALRGLEAASRRLPKLQEKLGTTLGQLLGTGEREFIIWLERLKGQAEMLVARWKQVDERVRDARPNVFVTHAFLMVSQISGVQSASLLAGALIVLGALHSWTFYFAAMETSVLGYFTMDDLLYEGVQRLLQLAAVLGVMEIVLFALRAVGQRLVPSRAYAVHWWILGRPVLMMTLTLFLAASTTIFLGYHSGTKERAKFFRLKNPTEAAAGTTEDAREVRAPGWSRLVWEALGWRLVRAENQEEETARGMLRLLANRIKSPPWRFATDAGKLQEPEVATMSDGTILKNVYLVGTTSRTAAFLQVDRWGKFGPEGRGKERRGEYVCQDSPQDSPEVEECVRQGRVLIVDRALVVCHAKGDVCEKQERRSQETPTLGEAYFVDFPVTFREADLDPACEHLSVEEHTGFDFETARLADEGIKYHAGRNRDLVRRMVRALKPCASITRPVLVKVQGFASSEPFAGVCHSASDELNVRVANARRASVEDALTEAAADFDLSSEEFRLVTVADYGTIGEMVAARRFQDRPWVLSVASESSEGQEPAGGGDVREPLLDYEPTRPQDWFTLSARIKVLDTGECEPR